MHTDKHGFFRRELRELAQIEFAKIRAIRVKDFFIRVHPCPSVVKKS
jgi:hypothetical protein